MSDLSAPSSTTHSARPRARGSARKWKERSLHRWRSFLLILSALLLSASSCDHSVDEGEPPLPTGLKIVSAFPDFPTLEEPDYVIFDAEWPVSLRLDLNQTAQATDLVFSFWPAPQEGWSPRASQTAPLFWIDGFTPDSTAVLQTILIDGPRFLHPWLWEFWVRQPEQSTGFITADVVQRHKDGPSPAHALILFYDRRVAVAAASAAELFTLPAQRAVLAEADVTNVGTIHREGTIFESVGDALTMDAEYTIGVILDTNGDGIYDAQEDWWGTAHTNSGGLWVPWFVPAEGPIQSHLLEAELLPPPAD